MTSVVRSTEKKVETNEKGDFEKAKDIKSHRHDDENGRNGCA